MASRSLHKRSAAATKTDPPIPGRDAKVASSNESLKPPRRRLPWLVVSIVGGLLLLVGGAVLADYFSGLPADAQANYVGRQTCVACHQEEVDAYRGSHHDLAMDLATDATVLGDFSDAELEHHGITSRMFKDGDKFMVHTEGPDGEMRDFHVKYVFGVHPLQQYMVEFDRTDEMSENEIARLQVLRISWDALDQRWFHLDPPDVDEKLDPHDDLHWTGIAQRWQTMCAECHSTDLQRNFDPSTGLYHTTFSEIDVSCEACHGPASLHVELANRRSLFWDRRHGYGLAKLKGEDPEAQLQACAPCHSRRGVIDGNFHAGNDYHAHFDLELLHSDTYFADGQIKDEVYVYGSFIQSRMYHKGIRCTDCHDPHSLELKQPGNATCTSCHQHPAGKYDTPAHHHHAPGTPGAACVNCHMPTRTYMGVDARRDHSLRIPRPDLSVKLGTPNACTSCHVEDQMEEVEPDLRARLEEYADWQELAEQGNEKIAELLHQTDRWSDEACERWYGGNRRRDPHFAEPITAHRQGEPESIDELLRIAVQPDELTPMIARATALDELVRSGDITPRALATAKEMIESEAEHPIVRATAVRAYGAGDVSLTQLRQVLLPLLEDSSALVRNEAARLLASSAIYQGLPAGVRRKVDDVLEEVRKGMMVANDRAGAHMGWAMLCEQRGRYQEAIDSYETAMRIEPRVTGPRTNLAALLESIVQQGRQSGQLSPGRAAAFTRRAAELRSEELPLLARDAKLATENPFVQYRYGLALYLDGQEEAALQQLQKAVDLEPSNETFRQAVRLLKEKMAGAAN